MSYGYRLYELKPYRGPRGRKALDWSDPFGTSQSVLDLLEDVGEDLAGKGALNGSANHNRPELYDPDADVQRGDPQIKFLSVDRLADDRLLLHVDYGVIGEYDRSYDAEGSSVSMRDRSTNLRLRMLLIAPQGVGPGILIVETWKSVCPTPTALGALGWAGSKVLESYVRLRAWQVADKAHLTAMADGADAIEAVLTEKRPGTPGARDGERVRLSFLTRTEVNKSHLLSEFLAAVSGGGSPKREVIERIETIAGLDPADLVAANLNFGQVQLAVEKNGERKMLNIDHVLARFTYRTGPVALSDPDWLAEVLPTADRVMSDLVDIDIEPDAD